MKEFGDEKRMKEELVVLPASQAVSDQRER
jgi:hypothetical protein